MSTTTPPKALLFDVFGTVVDWRSTVTSTLVAAATKTLNTPTSSLPSTLRLRASAMTPADWAAFAQAWRASYGAFTRSYDPTTDPWTTVDEHHHASLVQLLAERDLTGLWTELELVQLAHVWHYLDPWADSSAGLGLLNRKFQTCTLSNGNTSLLSDMAAFAGLPWTRIFSAEDFRAYKPNPRVYNGAAERLGLRTGECAMVAAHLGDLKAAKGCGYQTVYVERREEEAYSEEKIREARSEGWVDMWVGLEDGGDEEGKRGFVEVARRFGIEEAEKAKGLL